MAHETLKMLIFSKLPKRQVCSPQILALLAELNDRAKSFRAAVTMVYPRLPVDRQKAIMSNSRLVDSDRLVREAMAKLKENGVNLYGFDPMDFCEAFVEVYKNYAASR